MTTMWRCLAVFLFCVCACSVGGAKESYVVFMGASNKHIYPDALKERHHTLLNEALGVESSEHHLYSYTRLFNGFAARLTRAQSQILAQHPATLMVMKSRTYQLQTTRSWDFLGLGGLERLSTGTDETPLLSSCPGKSVAPWSNYASNASDVIIGLLDTGVWPESDSFSDVDMSPFPKRWKGFCQEGQQFNTSNCNRKIIGARYFYKSISQTPLPSEEYLSPRDASEHGTHTASTAAGRRVDNASCYGIANGIALGGAPTARLAIYKICWKHVGCDDADVLAGIEAGIEDGVDIFSMSLGDFIQKPYFDNLMSLAAFHAVRQGKLVVAAGGNSGPTPTSVVNVAPWFLTVGAVSTDRTLVRSLKLGDNQTIQGNSAGVGSMARHGMYPMVKGINPCLYPGPENVGGKIVVCNGEINPEPNAIYDAGAVGIVFYPVNIIAYCSRVPMITVSADDAVKIFEYMNSASSPVGYLTPTLTTFGDEQAPVVAEFSGRGPNMISHDILKPDVVAPGINILAAAPTPGNQTSPYKFNSGTSMAAPHVSGIAAVLKSAHPDWSPAAIKSALITTAYLGHNEGGKISGNFYDTGAGLVNPNAALDPGLVYDAAPQDYVNFLCDDSGSVRLRFIGVTCPANPPKAMDFNYPSITVPNLNTGNFTVNRKVTNVGDARSIYRVIIQAPDGVSVTVKPDRLSFHHQGETQSFKVHFNATSDHPPTNALFGHVVWKDHKHHVASPIVISALSVVT